MPLAFAVPVLDDVRVVFVEVCVAVLALGLVTLVVTTAVGSRRRGAHWILAVPAGFVFPLTWAAWYLRDLPPGRARHETR